MKYPKSILLTLIFYVSLGVLSCWILLIPYDDEYSGLLKISRLIDSTIALSLLIFIFKKINRSDLLKLYQTDNKYYFISIILGIGFVFFQSFLNIIYYQEISDDIFKIDFRLQQLTHVNILSSIIIIPIIEELFFRNYLQNELVKFYKPFNSILLSSILFASIHINIVSIFFESMDFSLHHAYIALFGGFISGVLLYKSKSIGPSIIFHVFWNLTSYVT
ncbi:hypothetical protein FBALC1_08438 [Flavobacteriales bacterium ALC-1]|nr:hypothetical protein FBALC1_08438 [Flavobacteriales bacterium ALC-1]